MLTDKQQKVYDYLVEYTQRRWCSPTYQEIMDIFWLKSKRSVSQYVEILESKWFIVKNSEYRWIKIWVQNNNHTVNIPILWYANCWMPLMVDPRK